MPDAAATAVVFDLGGVVIDWDPRYLFRKVLTDEAALGRFMGEVWSDAWNLSLDAGRPLGEAVAELIAAKPEARVPMEAFRDRWLETLGGPIGDTVAVLEALDERRVPLWAITNWSADTFPLARARPEYAFLDRFREIFVSGELRMLKPDPAIFAHALAAIGLPAATCLFVDDNLANVDGARRAGMQAHHFRGAAGLAEELRAHGLLR